MKSLPWEGAGPAPPASSLLFYFLLSFYLLLSLAPPQKVLGLLLAHSADVNARDKLWQTPLHVAAANRATKCAEALAPLLSSLNVADRSGRSALHHAVHSGHLEVRTMLVGTGVAQRVIRTSGLKQQMND